MQGAVVEPRGRIARAARWAAVELDGAAAFGIVIRPGAGGEDDDDAAGRAARPYVRLGRVLATG